MPECRRIGCVARTKSDPFCPSHAIAKHDEAPASKSPSIPESIQPIGAKHAAEPSLLAQAGRKGGQNRAKKLSPERRAEIARNAARARWEHDDD